MKTTSIAALILCPTVLACSGAGSDALPAPQGTDSTEPAPAEPGPAPSPADKGQPGTTSELVEALRKGAEPVFVTLRPGTRTPDGVVAPSARPVARAMRLAGEASVVVELLGAGGPVEAEVALREVDHLKAIDHARVGLENDRAVGAGFEEILDFDTDEAARRVIPMPTLGPSAPTDFDCVARFAKITASRDFIPFSLTNCAAPQPPVTDAERIADAVQARKVAQNIFDQMVTAYRNAQAMIAALEARLAAIRDAYVFIRHDPYYKEYNILHFKKFLHGRKSYNDRYERAEQLLVAAARAVEAQLALYRAVPPPDAALSRSQANRIVATKWNCVMDQGLLNNGGRTRGGVVGVSLETAGAPFVDVQIMLDDHPPLPQSEGWGGVFPVTVTPNTPSDVTRMPVADLVPVRASVGLPIVMFRIQPLDAKQTRAVGKACNLRVGIVQ